MDTSVPSKTPPPAAQNALTERLRYPAVAFPSRTAYHFLASEDTEPHAATYSEIDCRARSVAAELADRGLVGQRVLLAFDPGLDFIAAFLGCIYSGATAVPVYPPDPFRLHRTLERLQGIVADARAQGLLTTHTLLSLCDGIVRQSSIRHVIESDQIAREQADAWKPLPVTGSHLALLQYTSGSTGHPKGVMVTRDNLCHNMSQIHAHVDMEGAITACWLPVYHDMGLLAGVLQPWQSGRLSILMSPVAFFQKPLRWLKAIADYRVTTTVAPNFGYELCVRKTTARQRQTLDLRHWTIAMNGSEPVRAATLERFAAAFADSGFRGQAFSPCYGLAEATLFVAGTPTGNGATVRHFAAQDLAGGHARLADGRERSRTLVASGKCVANQRLWVVDPGNHQRLPDGCVGEIWLSGPNIADGYWRQADATQQTFAAFTNDGTGPFLRTGDTGFLFDGELFITGRIKDLLVVWGRNHDPQDIEESVERCDAALKPHGGAVFAVDDGERERVVVVHEVLKARSIDAEGLLRKIAHGIAIDHQLSVDTILLIPPGTLPKTTSGKIQRHKCRELYLTGRLKTLVHWETDRQPVDPAELAKNYVPPQTPTEEVLVEVWSDVLGIPQVGTHDNFFDLGGHSLLAAEVATRLENWLPVKQTLRFLLDYPTIAQLAEWIDAHAQHEGASPEKLERLLTRVEDLPDEDVERLLRDTWAATTDHPLDPLG